MKFPESFVWGAAAASYQIEGAAYEDGKGLSVWDMLCRQPDRIHEGDTGDVACDHYHRFREDVSLMADLGLNAYRFSLSWPRILPEGVGKVNAKGLGFYDALVDALLERGIEPWATLFHWDYPYDLFCRGGWLNPDSPKWFADYTAVVTDRLSDRVRHWMTLNEPQCFIGLGHRVGTHAPGLKLGMAEVLQAGHHALLAHGLAVQTIRAHSRQPAKIGWAPVGVVHVPDTDDAADVEAVRRAMFEITTPDAWSNTWWADPPLLGRYPEDGLRLFGKAAPRFTAAELETIHQPLDFYGANIYNGSRCRAGRDGNPEPVATPPGYPLTHFYWKQVPESLYWGPRFLYERYGKPIVITENGMSGGDWVSLDGKVHDPQRVDFLSRYLQAYLRAIRDGVDGIGYFVWSILDNFEWAEGYKQRFGLVHVDYTTLKRTPKDSFEWYANLIRTHGESLASSP